MPKIGLNWNIEWSQPITLPALTKRLHEEGLGRADLIAALEARSEELTDELCGPRYHPIEDSPYRRAGTKKRTLGTRFGRIHVRIHRVKDTRTGETFTPLWTDVTIKPKKIHQRDLDALTEQAATRMTYRNTNEELGKTILGVASAHTINRRLIEDGNRLRDYLHKRDLIATAHQADGTKLHGQDRAKKDVNITLATGNDAPRLRSITVGEDWEGHQPALRRTHFQNINGEPIPGTAITDFEKGLHQKLVPEGGHWQGDHVHVPRTLRYNLWQDGMGQSDERKAIVQTAVGILSHLRNSLNLHLPKGESDAIRHRIKQTIKEFRRLATRIENEGYYKAAGFLRNSAVSVTTFATLALEGIQVPWHNNHLERLMGEVSKRCKHKWMSWTGRGASALLTFVAVRAIEPETFEAFWRGNLYGANGALPDLGVRITRLGVGC